MPNANLIIANCISFIAAIFTCASSISKDKKRIYFYQVGQCLILAVANIFFQSYAGIITLILCAGRNFLLGIDRFNKYICISLASLMLLLGLLLNNNGYIGYIVIAANVIYTIGGYIAKKEIAIKINIILDLALWIIYEFLIFDIPSLIFDAIALALAVISIFRTVKERRQKSDNT